MIKKTKMMARLTVMAITFMVVMMMMVVVVVVVMVVVVVVVVVMMMMMMMMMMMVINMKPATNDLANIIQPVAAVNIK